MSKVPVPPKRTYKNRVVTQEACEISSRPASGSGFNVAKSLQDTALDFDVMGSRPPRNMAPKISQQVKPRPSDNHESLSQNESEFLPTLHDILDEAPDIIIGEDVEIKGDFQFDGLLHLYGRFEGRLLSDGDVYLGPKAVLKSNVQHINRLIIDGGHVIGRISVQQLGIAGAAFVKGDISCKYIEVNSDDCTIVGKLYVHPQAPEVVEFPRERLSPKEDIAITQSAPTKPIESSPSPVKETLEVSIQVADPDEILTPAELALRAKLEAKERRKEAKRHQQEEFLKQSQGLAPLSPENKKETPNEASLLASSSSSSPPGGNSLKNAKSLGSIQSPQILDPEPSVEIPTEKNDEGEENTDSPIKLVSGEIGEAENDRDISVSNSPQRLSTLDQWSTPSAAEELSTLDDIHSPQKTVVSAVSIEATAVISEDNDQEETDSLTVPKNEEGVRSLEQERSRHSSPEKTQSSNLPMAEVEDEGDPTRVGLILPPSPQQRAELLAQEQEEEKHDTEQVLSDVTGAENFATPTDDNQEPDKEEIISQSPKQEEDTDANKDSDKDEDKKVDKKEENINIPPADAEDGQTE